MPTLPEGAIRVEHVWKRFRAERAKPQLSDQLAHVGRRLRGQRNSWRWVLKDINLSVDPGETVALVGVNGSGKSTLLKVISQVTYQSAGRCELQGRIGALLEVRSGIHPDLTGRENVYLYGAILGLTRREIAARFDDIVEFAEVTSAIDRQIKFYSSGMQVRLGFAIAVFLEPAVLLVDEVLAVGDASFQQKCLERIGQVVANGTTLLFVSHDLAAVEATCDRAMWLVDGVARAAGPTREVVSLYREAVEQNAALAVAGSGAARVVKAEVTAEDGGLVRSGGPLHARAVLELPEADTGRIHIGVSEGTAMPVFVCQHFTTFPAGQVELRCAIPYVPLPHGRYSLWMSVTSGRSAKRQKPYLSWQPVASFDVFGPRPVKPPQGVMVPAAVHVDAVWECN